MHYTHTVTEFSKFREYETLVNQMRSLEKETVKPDYQADETR